MRIPLFGIAGPILVASTAAAQPPPSPPPPSCEPAADQICDQYGPEDIVAIGDDWVATGAFSGPGGLILISTADREAHSAYPSDTAIHSHDSTTYPDCPGPPDPADFLTHGLYVEPGRGPVHKLFVVGHGTRESIEIFNVDTTTSMPTVTWLGCVVAPDPIGLNSVRGLPSGGFVTTNFLPRNSTPEETNAMRGGAENGELWEWHTQSGWSQVPGSAASGANGLELSADGQTIYVAAWGSQSFFRLSRGINPPQRDEVSLGFRVDNIHWARDGTLYAVGQAGTDWTVVSVDPQTLEATELLTVSDAPEFGAGTAVAEIGEDFWVGSFRGNRIRIVPAP